VGQAPVKPPRTLPRLTQHSIGSTGSLRLPKFSFTMRLPAMIRAARNSAFRAFKARHDKEIGGSGLGFNWR